MIRRPPRSTRVRSSAASDVYKRQVHARAVWRKRICNGADRILVLFAILAGACERSGKREVMLVVARAADRAREDPGEDKAALEPYEHFRGCAEEAVDVERPAVGIFGGELGQRPPYVEGFCEVCIDIAGQNNLVEFAGLDMSDTLRDDRLPGGAVDRTVAESCACRSVRCGGLAEA